MLNETALADGLNHLRQALAERRLFTGHLLNPTEVAEISATADVSLPPGWLMSGEMHPEMFDLVWAKQPKLLQSPNTFQTSNGLLYGVVVQQFGTWQHRFVVQLLGEDVKQFLRESKGSPMLFSLSNCNGPQATVFSGPDEMRLTLPDVLKFPPVPSDASEVVAVSAGACRSRCGCCGRMRFPPLDPSIPSSRMSACPSCTHRHSSRSCRPRWKP